MIKNLLFLCSLALTSAQAGAIIYSNIDSSFPVLSGGTYGGDVGFIGTAFTTTAGGPLGLIEFNFTVDGTATMVPAALYADAGGQPGTLLESWNVPVPTYPDDALTVLTSVVNPILSAGTKYWFVFNEGSNPPATSWTGNDESVNGGIWASPVLTSMSQSSTAFATPGIELLTTPEPGTAILLGTGFLLLAGARRGFRRQG